MSKKYVGVLACVLALGVLSAPAMAQPLHSQPASLLIFPLYNSTAGNNTLLTVTNTNEDENSCDNGFRQGDIQVHYIYFSETCAETDTQEDLTPADTITVLARGHNPNFEKGYLVVEARDPEQLVPTQFDFLIGSAIVVNSEFDFQWAYTPYAFEALFTDTTQSTMNDDCGRPILDMDNGQIDFDGMEYNEFPETLYLDHFFGEGTDDDRPGVTFGNMIFLMSTQPEDTNLSVLGWNNNERRFSRTFPFDCYFMGTLGEITQAVTQANLATDADTAELLGINYGWLRLRSQANHGILGVFSHTAAIGADSFVAGRELQYSGTKTASIPRLF